MTPFLFGIILHLRFKRIGRRKRTLALCVFLYLLTLIMPGPSMLYNDHVVANSGAETRLFGAIREWSQTHNANTPVVWTQKQILNYVLITFPMHFIGQWGLFALLWFGSLDPRTPGQGRAPSPFRGRWLERFSKRGSRRGPLAERVWVKLPL